jgi:hypothetical protein
MIKKQPKIKPITNKGKKYEKPLSLYGMKFEQLVNIGLKIESEQKV